MRVVDANFIRMFVRGRVCAPAAAELGLTGRSAKGACPMSGRPGAAAARLPLDGRVVRAHLRREPRIVQNALRTRG